jgi:glycosyltransferase involved in cell wall biosynthesis
MRVCHARPAFRSEFFDVEHLAALALTVLKDPRAWRSLGADGRALVEARYSLEKTLPRLWDLFTHTATC